MVKPGTDAERGAEQRRALPGRRQRSGGAPDRLRLRLTGPGEPAPQPERMTGGFEDRTPVDDRRGSIHAKPHTFDDGRLVPRVNYPPIDGGLPANSFEAGTPEPGRFEGVPGEQRVEARDGPGGALECTRDIDKAGECTA